VPTLHRFNGLTGRRRHANAATRAALDAQNGADAVGDVVRVARQRSHDLQTQELRGAGTDALGFNQTKIAKAASNLAALVAIAVAVHAARAGLGSYVHAARVAYAKAVLTAQAAQGHVVETNGVVATQAAMEHASTKAVGDLGRHDQRL